MNISEIAKRLTAKGHKNAYQKLNFLTRGGYWLLPENSTSFIDDAIEIIKQDSLKDVRLLQEQRKEYLSQYKNKS